MNKSILLLALFITLGSSFSPRVLAACDWPVLTDPDLVNIFYPDTNADYWVSVIPAVPGTRLRIEGQYPNARYFSFNVYDPMGRPMDAAADIDLHPDEGHHNPFILGDDQWGGRYTAFIEIGEAPSEPETNTIYTGVFQPRSELPSTSLGNPTFSIMYRVYIPGTPGNPEGDIPLPRLILELPVGEGAEIPLERCGPFTDSPLSTSPLNDAALSTDYPQDTVLIENTDFIKDEPEFVKFYGLPSALAYFGNNVMQGNMPDNPAQNPDGDGLYSNVDNSYVFGAFERGHGDVYVVRAKAPTYRGDPRLADFPDEEQLRYWSLCTTEFITQRYVDCFADHHMVLDEDGYFTLIVSDEADRPDNAYPEYGVNWLPWGAYPDSNLVYRHMLPNATFAEAIQNVPFGTPIGDIMLEYAPEASYCTREAVEAVPLEQAGVSQVSQDEAAEPADILESCRNSTEIDPEGEVDPDSEMGSDAESVNNARATRASGGSMGWLILCGALAALLRRRTSASRTDGV